MRRLLLSLSALGLLSAMVGCKTCDRGICDCQHDDHCCTRQPWINQGSPVGNGIVAPPIDGGATPAVTYPGSPAPHTPIMPPAHSSRRVPTSPHAN